MKLNAEGERPTSIQCACEDSFKGQGLGVYDAVIWDENPSWGRTYCRGEKVDYGGRTSF